MSNLLLIDNRVNDIKTVIESLLENTKFLIVDYNNDTFETIKDKIIFSNYDNIGIFQENYQNNTYKFINSFEESIITDVQTVDPNLTTWLQFKHLLSYFKNELNCNNIDLLGCNINRDKNWKYVNNKLEIELGVNIRSSDDYTGSTEIGGNWILESDNIDLIGTYFTENINNYNFILGGNTAQHTALIDVSGNIWACGLNNYGQLGDGTTIDKNTLVQMTMPNGYANKAISVSTGGYHTIVLMNDGTVWACGSNSSGQLGDGTTITRTTLVQMIMPNTYANKAISVSVGHLHTTVLMNDGTCWSCGYNFYGQLGDDTKNNRNTLVQMIMPNGYANKAISVSGGGYHTVILMDDGTVWACGDNQDGQFGNATTTDSKILVQMIMPNAYTNNAINISTGQLHTVVLMDDGTVWACGSNFFGQLGDGTTITRTTLIQINVTYGARVPISVSAGGYHTIVLMDDGTVWTCGWNFLGQLGDGTNNDINTLVQMTMPTDYANKANSVSRGYTHTIVLMDDGTCWACGENSSGQLGDNSNDPRNTLVQILKGVGNPITNVLTKKNCSIIVNNIPSNILKKYDGNTSINISPYNIYIYVFEPNINPTLSFNFDNRNVGSNKNIIMYVLPNDYIYPLIYNLYGSITQSLSLKDIRSNQIKKIEYKNIENTQFYILTFVTNDVFIYSI